MRRREPKNPLLGLSAGRTLACAIRYVNLVVFLFFFFLVNDQGRKTQAKLLCSLGIAVCRNASKSWGIIPQARQIIRFAVEVNKLVLSLSLINSA